MNAMSDVIVTSTSSSKAVSSIFLVFSWILEGVRGLHQTTVDWTNDVVRIDQSGITTVLYSSYVTESVSGVMI